MTDPIFHMIADGPRPVAPFSHAVECDGWVLLTGQRPTDPAAPDAPLPEGIEAQIGTYAVNRLSAYRDRGSFPGADAAFTRALALPFAATLTEDDIDRVASVLVRFA